MGKKLVGSPKESCKPITNKRGALLGVLGAQQKGGLLVFLFFFLCLKVPFVGFELCFAFLGSFEPWFELVVSFSGHHLGGFRGTPKDSNPLGVDLNENQRTTTYFWASPYLETRSLERVRPKHSSSVVIVPQIYQKEHRHIGATI